MVKVGDNVRLMRRYGSQTVSLPAIVLAVATDHKRLRMVEPDVRLVVNPETDEEYWEPVGKQPEELDYEEVPADDETHERVLDVTNAPPLAKGQVHLVYFALQEPTARLAHNVPLSKADSVGEWCEA